MTTPIIPPPWATSATPEASSACESTEPLPPKDGKGRWLPGISGNPRGRVPGVPNKRSPLEARVAEHGEAIMDKVIEAALAGDLQAANIALQRISPPLRARAEKVSFELDPDAPFAHQASAVLLGVSRSEIDPDTGKMLIDCITAAAGLRRFDEFAEELRELRAGMVQLVQSRGGRGGVLEVPYTP